MLQIVFMQLFIILHKTTKTWYNCVYMKRTIQSRLFILCFGNTRHWPMTWPRTWIEPTEPRDKRDTRNNGVYTELLF